MLAIFAVYAIVIVQSHVLVRNTQLVSLCIALILLAGKVYVYQWSITPAQAGTVCMYYPSPSDSRVRRRRYPTSASGPSPNRSCRSVRFVVGRRCCSIFARCYCVGVQWCRRTVTLTNTPPTTHTHTPKHTQEKKIQKQTKTRPQHTAA